jgi:hypothetical protein
LTVLNNNQGLMVGFDADQNAAYRGFLINLDEAAIASTFAQPASLRI